MKKAVGVCLGASTVSMALVEIDSNKKINITESLSRLHNGDPRGTLLKLIQEKDISKYPIAVTGRKFRSTVKLESISEPTAVELAYEFESIRSGRKFNAIAGLGGETFIVYNLDGTGKIAGVNTKNQCASGTGEFFLQQIKRMDLSLDESIDIAEGANPYRVSGRCSVFCKSDCTHALNKGVPKGEVTSGLAQMIAEKITDLLAKNKHSEVIAVGGVTKNNLVIDFLRKDFPSVFIPETASYFEAFGAALHALENNCKSIADYDDIFIENKGSFAFHKPLKDFADKVAFKSGEIREAIRGERCILGLDVGSTTTKAVIISEKDSKILAKVYLYTNGNPIEASKQCYAQLAKQVNGDISIIGLGVTGSGRHIAGLHALTEGIFNEITAHSTAAIHFDSEVDTIFEIGGQDAKYTYIINKVPADYAMNEACSAGTGSFIEESAWESLGIKVQDIQDIAMRGLTPPNFSDQCAAFISSDIKTAQQEGLDKDNIIAGLVYSICLNYVNRVKGNREVGKKIFMQGGVCYNRAIPIAMAALTGRDIIVPPEPGLMGAYGVALEVKEKMELGLLKEKSFDLKELASREVIHRKPFVCAGGKEKCDLKCEINMIEVQGKKYPFGGSCNKYYSLNSGETHLIEKFDFVKRRNELCYTTYSPDYNLPANAPTVGVNASFHTHTLYPLYHTFFAELGYKMIVPDKVDEDGLNREQSSFCFPSQISLGMFQDLLNKKPDYIFNPCVLEMHTDEDEEQRLDFNCTCVFVSGEPFYLKQAFKDYDLSKMISPSLNFANGWDKELKTFIEVANQLGISDTKKIEAAYSKAVKRQDDFQKALFELGDEYLQALESNPKATGIVLIGRPYNAFVDHANKGIPQKFASRGVYVAPFDLFDSRHETIEDNMYWEGGKKILRAAKTVKKNPRLFATYISNFSCGPDSMIMTTFRDIMGAKPSLTLELDSHSADAGINTRIEAALDIIDNYRKISQKISDPDYSDFTPAYIEFGDPTAYFVCSDGTKVPLNDPSVEVLIPSMGDLAASMFAASLRSLGFNAKAIELPTHDVLKLGKANTTGKECLPLIMMAGSLLDYIENKWDGKTKLAFFIVQGAGNCRLGQYPVFMRDLFKRKRLKNVAQMILMNEDGFAGLGGKFALRGIQAILATDVLEDIRSAIMANAVDPEHGYNYFMARFAELTDKVASDPDKIYNHLDVFAKQIKENVPARIPIEESKFVALLGEIYVRRDGFSHNHLNKTFAEKGFVIKDAYISEWIMYVDYLLQIDLLEPEKSIKKKFERYIRNFFMRDAEKKIKKALEKSGYYQYHRTEIEPILKHSQHILPWEFKGEPGLTLGTALHEAYEHYCGIINVGPFGCMPTRFTEALAMPEMNLESKTQAKQMVNPKYEMPKYFNGKMNIPFLTIETDGNVYPQVVNARIESFMLQADRVDKIMKKSAREGKK